MTYPNVQWSLEKYRQKASKANRDGEALAACDIAKAGLDHWPTDYKLRQSLALSLARMGSREKAREILRQLQNEMPDDEENAALLASTHKDDWLATGSEQDLAAACENYASSYAHSTDRYWSGINAATLAFAKGECDEARRLARQILATCAGKLNAASEEEAPLLVATSAEAYLVLEDIPEAELWYARAAAAGKERLGDLLSAWKNARILLSMLPSDVHSRIERALQVPKIAVFGGHRVDAPNRPEPRFPEQRTPAVKESIRVSLVESGARIGYSSAASGSDILFLEAMQELGGKTHVVLPCNQAQFLQESVASSGESWAARFEAVLKNVKELIVASSERLSLGSVGYDYANELMYGLATLRSRQNGTELVHLAVWDGREGDDRGGTADIVKRWREHTNEITVIRPNESSAPLTAPREAVPGPLSPPDHVPAAGIRSEIRAFLFADAHHFSSLSEAEIPLFLQHFVTPLAMLVRETHPAPLFQNTWGDGLYMVFASVGEAGTFALKLASRIAAIDREKSGLPKDIALRIALHAGPAYRYQDQIINRLNYLGAHVNRAARIEPVTPPGQIYVTDAFAALAELNAPGQFHFDYVGKIPLAKSFGEFPIYNMLSAG